ncbi:MAG TPA: TetR/AcrR family transcriptional regulator [Planctomycetes bacterium]|nr:TetR/AcrR family transcriptional regulator [Planctomycetota bacterium]
MSTKRLTRKQRERMRHKGEILKSALCLFSQKGFGNVSMQEIAKESEFSVGTLYNFFESKEALFEELISSTGQEVLSELLEVLEGPGSEKERLSAFIRHQQKFQEKHGDVIKLYVSEFGIMGSKLSKIRHGSQIHKVLDSILEELVREGIRKGYFRAVDPAITAKSLGAITETLIFETTGCVDPETVTEMFAKVEQLFIDGLIRPEGRNDE